MTRHNFKKLFLLLFFVVLLGVFFLFYLTPALAQPPQQGINEFLNETNLKAVSLPQAIGRIVRIVLTFLGLIAVVIMIVGGFIWMTSGGQSDKIEKAKKIMLAGLVGLLIIVLAYAIASFITNILLKDIAGGGGGMTCPPDQCTRCDYLCNGAGNGENYRPDICHLPLLCGGPSRCACPPGSVPHIMGAPPGCQNISPSQGPVGQYVTIQGCRFGSYVLGQSKVYFKDQLPPNTEYEANVVKCNGNPVWSDRLIVVEVPNIALGGYDVRVVDSSSHNSDNTKPFTVVSGTAGPSIACVRPDNGHEGSTPTIEGTRFGATQGTVTFNYIASTSIISWTNTEIVTTVPADAFSGDVVVTDTINQPSNGYYFSVTCGAGSDCHSGCCKNGECDLTNRCTGFNCANANQSCASQSCCSGLTCCADQVCRADCGHTPGQSCKMPDNSCGADSLCSPYQCQGSISPPTPPNECRCCCRDDAGCPNGLKCETNETCYQGQPPDPNKEVKGLCCGCTGNSQCGVNNLCRTNPLPRCCVGCQLQPDNAQCYVPGMPNNTGECCNGQCCHGYCINGECLTTCNNNILETNERCDLSATPSFHTDKDTCHKIDAKYLDGVGVLGCNPNCTFNFSDCMEEGAAGGIGEVCQKTGNPQCASGAANCKNPAVYTCLANGGTDCRCCCDPANNKCPNGLTCEADKSPCGGASRGLCCGCKDDSQCGNYSVCDSGDSCCHNFLPPGNLSFQSNENQLQIFWSYSKDDLKYVTAFEIFRAGPMPSGQNCPTDISGYVKIGENKDCSSKDPAECNYIDHGSFQNKFCYWIRAKHGTHTAYSDWSKGEFNIISLGHGCNDNYYASPDQCPSGKNCCGSPDAPCCNVSTNQCVTIDLCQGNCNFSGACQPAGPKYAEADFDVTSQPLGACLISVLNIDPTNRNCYGKPCGFWANNIEASGRRFESPRPSPSSLTFVKSPVSADALISNWFDTTILAKVPRPTPPNTNFGVNNVSVIIKSVSSNEVSFRVDQSLVAPGEICNEATSCPDNISACWNPRLNPPVEVYTCLIKGIAPPPPEDCRCCCNTSNDQCPQINSKLSCKQGAGNCSCPPTNPTCGRGLCCGCTADLDCGAIDIQGCAALENNPKCCYSRPIVQEPPSPNRWATGVCLNTAIDVTFAQLQTKIDKNSLNLSNVRLGFCGDDQNCGVESSVQVRIVPNDTGFTLYPINCRLQAFKWYQVTLKGGLNGEGIRSAEGVSMIQSGDSWVFQTDDHLCQINSVKIDPPDPKVIYIGDPTHDRQDYTAKALDANGRAVCVTGLNWQSTNPAVATVNPNNNIFQTTAKTAGSKGNTNIIASVQNKSDSVLLTAKFTTLRIEEDNVCQPPDRIYPSPSPSKNYNEACVNIRISARFNKNVKDNSVNSSTIKVYDCGTVSCGAIMIPVNGNITVLPYNFDKEKFIFAPNIDLASNHYYQVRVIGNLSGVEGDDGSNLPADYIWQFKTRNSSDPCPIEYVGVTPTEWKTINPIPENINYFADAIGPNCQLLNNGSYLWSWNSTKPTVATVKGNLPPNTFTAVATTARVGETDIEAQTTSKTGRGHLIVATVPTIIDHKIKGDSQNVCLNSTISVTFDQEMDWNTLNGETVKLYVHKAGWIPPPQGHSNLYPIPNFLRILFGQKVQAAVRGNGGTVPDWPEVDGRVINTNQTVGSQIQTVTEFIPSEPLEELQEYKFVVLKDVVKSKYGIGLVANFILDFNTRDPINNNICKCQNPWPDPVTYLPYEDSRNNNHFEFWYCRDAGDQTKTDDDLPALPLTPIHPTQEPIGGKGILFHDLFAVPTKPDVIGLQGYPNPDHLTISEWHKNTENVPNPGGAASVAVDSYAAIKDGRTVYVAATNLIEAAPHNLIYTNVYLISYNDGASGETQNIVSQIIKNWRFNTNKNGNTYSFTKDDKTKLQRDLQRIYQFNTLDASLQVYKNNYSVYPTLPAGSYIAGMSTSHWPSWQQTLAKQLGGSLITDSINKFKNRNDCQENSETYQCCADCPKKNPQCDSTCYNPALNQRKYECISGSQVYQYMSEDSGQDYSFYANFEYSLPNFWANKCSAYTSQKECQLHHWCVWNGSLGACVPKDLDYSGDPCSGLPNNSTCACFNMRYKSARSPSVPMLPPHTNE